MAPDPQRALVVFHVAGKLAALPIESVYRVEPMAELARPPGLPAALEGFLDLAGCAVPVLRLDHLFGLPAFTLGLYSTLILLKTSSGRIAIVVDRVGAIVSVGESALLPVGREDSFNGCAEATARVRDQIVHLLSPERILLEKERAVLSEFQQMASHRLAQWGRGQ